MLGFKLLTSLKTLLSLLLSWLVKGEEPVIGNWEESKVDCDEEQEKKQPVVETF